MKKITREELDQMRSDYLRAAGTRYTDPFEFMPVLETTPTPRRGGGCGLFASALLIVILILL